MDSQLDGSTWSHQKVFSLILAFRLVNALTIRTFFQPDEYFQSLEPAWELAFGLRAKAWITWEWHHRLRSSLHPFFFSAVYMIAGRAAQALSLSTANHSALLIAAPKLTQAIFATCTDYFTWRLGATLFGEKSAAARASLLTTVSNPWQWFCSTRTFSNSIETTLTAFALSKWPWELPAIACVLRPTNLLVWVCVASMSLLRAANVDRLFLVFSAALYGLLVLSISVLLDRAYYGAWTMPALRFLGLNVGQSVASFYGRNRSDYYLTEGIPLLLTTALPFAVHGVVSSLKPVRSGVTAQESVKHQTLKTLSYTCVLVTIAFSSIPHKEVRFLYPLLPAFIVLSAPSIAHFVDRAKRSNRYRPAAFVMMGLNVAIAIYTTQFHQRGVVDAVHFLRQQYEMSAFTDRPSPAISAVFLMPCHSTPWRSHLVYADINAWALTCEPPIGLPEDTRAGYLDEADQFYDDPHSWLLSNMADDEGTIRRDRSNAGRDGSRSNESTIPGQRGPGQDKRPWPEYLVFFEQLEDSLLPFKSDLGYETRQKFFNTHWHDDWRRKGDVVIWHRPQPVVDSIANQ
ncbi:hypothetical protein P152DRAFT_393056 [Eremomyces bilateralis CBS 781.70]|uniref:Mannosyltransferase n=1 Tax=Eremomyces bilateralis CBS 781.70 TaxID=1392243 RepID=A0A6G1G946_9PEZI|nr:uncharacterized protein P152DRAFT_393056 [Eremomyces bilateralis CBS 781.70]KAF1814512.1 hypothetical protein P152DRAFT_393056 [Eremomyces bilateralis CBS 781.70]